MRSHVAERVAIKCGVGSGGIIQACLYPRNPGSFRQVGDVADYVGPGLAGVAGDLQISIVGAYPNGLRFPRRFADGINGGVHLGIGIVNGYAAGFFLFLFFRIVGGQIRRNAIPGLAVIAGAE